MPNFPLFKYTALMIALLSCFANADIITLKDGEKVEGKILSENETELVVEIQETASIKDERIIARADVEKVEKASPEETTWKVIKAYNIGTDSLPQTHYEQMIAALKAFASAYPESPNTPEAKAKTDRLQEELDRVTRGEIKLGNKWLTKDELARERVQITAQVLFNNMKSQYSAGQLTDAMNTFDRMEKTTPGTRVYPEAVELARKVMPLIKDAATRELDLQKAREAEFRKRVQMAEGAEKQKLRKDADGIRTRLEANLKQFSNLKWYPLKPSNQDTLYRLISLSGTEIQRLSYLKLDNMRISIAHTKRATEAIKAKDFETAEKALKDAEMEWVENEQIARLKAEIMELKTRAEAEVAKAKEMAAAEAAEKKKADQDAQAEAAKVLAKEALTKKASAQDAPVVAEEEQSKPEEAVNWPFRIALIVLALVLIGAARFVYKKFVAPENNILDQK